MKLAAALAQLEQFSNDFPNHPKAREARRIVARAREEEMAGAKAIADGNLAMARELQELKAANARRDQAEAQGREAQARADLLAKRPDFPHAVKATLSKLPLKQVEEAVRTWPKERAIVVDHNATPEAAYVPRLTVEEQSLIDKCEAKPSGQITQAQARARLAEIDRELGRTR